MIPSIVHSEQDQVQDCCKLIQQSKLLRLIFYNEKQATKFDNKAETVFSEANGIEILPNRDVLPAHQRHQFKEIN